MKPFQNLLLIIGLLLSQALLSQKNAPVAGDAAQLVDLLKKDYNSIDPSTRNDELIKDRALVIATFKSYMTEIQNAALTDEIKKTSILLQKYDSIQIAYKKAQQVLSLYSSITVSAKDDNEARRIKETLTGLSNNVETYKGEYYTAKYKADDQELGFLKTVYNSKNEYAEYIIEQFINKYKAINNNVADALAKSNPNTSLQKGIPFLGGDMGFEVIIEGLSKFLSKRIKEELTTHVIDKVKEWLENPKENDPLSELKVLLPRTNAYLIDFKASQVTNFPNEIKQYIEDDFNHIIENMDGLRNTPRIQRLMASHPDVDFAMEALQLIPNLSKIKNPIDYFETIENSRNLSRWKESNEAVKFNIANTLQLSSMLAHSLTIIEGGQPRFAGSDFISTYGSDLNFYLLYVGFLNQQNTKYYDIHFFIKADNNFKLTTINDPSGINKAGEDALQFKFPLSEGFKKLVTIDLLSGVGTIGKLNKDRKFFETTFIQIGKNAEKVYTSALEIKKANKKGDKIGPDTVYTFVKSIIELAEEVTAAGDTLVNYLMTKAEIINKKITAIKIDYSIGTPIYTITSTSVPGSENIHSLQLKEKAEPYFAVANKTNDIVLDLQKTKYATALIKALEVTTEILPNKLTQSMNFLSNSITIMPEIQTNLIGNKSVIDGWFTEDWFKVIPVVNGSTAGVELKVDKELAASATLIYDELIKIKNYYFSHYEVDQKVMKDIGKLIVQVKNMQVKGNTNNSNELAEVKALLANPTFHYILISFYSNLRVDEFAEKLENEMKQYTVDIKGNAKNIFTDKEAEDLKKSFLTYIDATFTFLINNDKAALDTANQIFKNTALDFLLRAPEKFNFHLDEKVLKLIHFVNDMAVSENSDDIEKAIEAFALPAGSYSIKREAKFNISVNSFPGILPAIEATWKNNITYGSFSPAFTVPVGLSFTWGSKCGISQGIYMPIIDIGAVTRMHLSDDIDTDTSSSSTLPEFSFLSVFSPGLYYHLGFRKTPFSLNIGAQYGPGLREIKNNGDTKVYESVRFGIGFVIDIPLLNLHTKPRFKE